MTAKKIRLLFLILFITLPLQYAMVGIVGELQSEPWPAFVFPGFKSIYTYDDGHRIDQVYFEIGHHDSQEVRRMLPHHLFPELPRSQISGFLREHFQGAPSAAEWSDDALGWLGEQAERHAGGDPAYVDIIEEREYFSSQSRSVQPDSVQERNRTRVWLP